MARRERLYLRGRVKVTGQTAHFVAALNWVRFVGARTKSQWVFIFIFLNMFVKMTSEYVSTSLPLRVVSMAQRVLVRDGLSSYNN